MKGYGFLLLVSGALMYWYTDFISSRIANPDEMFLFVFFSLVFLALGAFILIITFVTGAWSYRKSKVRLGLNYSKKSVVSKFGSSYVQDNGTNIAIDRNGNNDNKFESFNSDSFNYQRYVSQDVLKTCPYCGSFVRGGASICSYCGSRLY